MLTINNTLDGYLKDVEIKGNTIQDASNLADIRSVGDKVEGQELYEIPVLITGKNICTEIELGSINSNGLNVNSNANFRSKYFVSIAGGSTIKASSGNDALVPQVVYQYDNDFNCLGVVQNNITLSNAKYVKVVGRHIVAGSDITNYIPDAKIQLEYGTQATPYEPYQEDKLTILSPVQLEKVGDVADRIIEKNGVWGIEKNIFNVDETLNWVESGWSPQSNTIAFKVQGIKNNNVGICNMFPLNISNSTSDIEAFSVSTTWNEIAIRVNKERLSSLNVAGFKNWLSTSGIKLLHSNSNLELFIPLPHDQQVKLRTFANKTNISFLTEIEGTIKAQVPKSLGATVNTHTEQINNLNKELDRVKKLEESTVSTVTTESDFTTVEATSNGYFEDVKLEGKTLVNLIKNFTSETFVVKNYELYPIKPYTTYTAIIDITANNTCYYGLFDNTSMNWAIPACNLNTSGRYVVKMETNNSTNIAFRINGANNDITIHNLIFLEGDHTQNPPSFFEGLKSVGQETDEIVVSSVKGDGNLFDSKSLSDGYIDNGVPNNWNSHFKTDFIRVEGNTVYFSEKFTPIQVAFVFAEYDINKNFIRNSHIYEQRVGSFTTHSDCAYIRITSAKDSLSMDELSANIKLYKNSMYNTPHKSDKKRLLFYNNETQTWEKPILREWDSIEKHANGKYYYHKRSGEVVLNGTHSTSTYGNESDTHITFNTHIPNSNGVANGNLICEKFKCASVLTNNDCVWMLTPNNFYIRLNKSLLITQDVEGFKQWLQANNVTVVYQLAQEKVYECTNIDLITYSGETNYIVESGVIVPRSTLKVHNNISNVVSLLQKKVSILDDKVTGILINAQSVEDETSIVGNKLNLTTDKYQVTNMVNNTQIVLPTVDKFTEIHLFFDATSDMTLVYPSVKWQTQPTIKANASYEFIFTYVNDAWLGGYIVRK